MSQRLRLLGITCVAAESQCAGRNTLLDRFAAVVGDTRQGIEFLKHLWAAQLTPLRVLLASDVDDEIAAARATGAIELLLPRNPSAPELDVFVSWIESNRRGEYIEDKSTVDDKVRTLFVDDDPALIDLLVLKYEDRFEVLTAQSPREAIELLEHYNVNAVVTDYEMPECDGVELLRYLRDHHPSVRRALMSGGLKDHFDQHIESGLAERFFSKPAVVEELSSWLEQASGSNSGAADGG